jgi:Family of unknown function (DUF5990)
MSEQITLHIILEKPTPGVDFGLQQGAGSHYTTVQTQRSTGNDLGFSCMANLKINKSGQLDFSGPFVQGKPGERFLYIDIGAAAAQKDTCWQRRLKIPLAGFNIKPGNNGVYETRVPGTGKDGGPNCATVKPFAGWRKR